MSEPRRCRLAKRRPIPFDCKLDAGHEGKCTPYTLRPLTRDQWAEQRRKADDAELLRRNRVSDQQDWVPGLEWPSQEN